MHYRDLRHAFRLALTIPILLTIWQLSASAASTEKVLHDFGAAGDGANPQAPLVFDTRGNLYGTTVNGGTGGCFAGSPCGIIFQLAPNQDGSWSEIPIHVFGDDGGVNGGYDDAPVVFDRRGNLYGSAYCAVLDCETGGLIFQLLPGSDGSWGFQVIKTSPVQNSNFSGLAFDDAGQLYGSENGQGSQGNTFLLKEVSVLGWYEIAVHAFAGGADGAGPVGALTFDSSGNIYGATSGGGLDNNGIVYKLTPNRFSFGWRLTVLYQFMGGSDGSQPTGVIFDNGGNLFGTTTRGGDSGNGTVFKLTPNSDGSWSESVVHSFAGGSDGAAPLYAPTLDAVGNIYGTTLDGGSGNAGVVYELSPSGGQWQETVLHAFSGGTDGGTPFGGVILDSAGNIYGTTYSGGQNGGGVAFELSR